MDRKAKIRSFINQSLAKLGKGPVRSDSEPLVSSRLIDSILLVELVIYLGDEFGLKSSVHGFNKEKFETIEGIARMIGEP